MNWHNIKEHLDDLPYIAQSSTDYLYIDQTFLFVMPGNLWAFILHTDGHIDQVYQELKQRGYQVVYGLEQHPWMEKCQDLEVYIAFKKTEFPFYVIL